MITKIASASAIALASTLLLAPAAQAALETAPAGDYSTLYTIGVTSGNVYRFDRATESTELVCESTNTSDEWITGSAFDPATNTLHWIRNFSSGEASIVSVDMATCDQTVLPIDIDNRGSSADAVVFGLTWNDGAMEMLYLDSNDSDNRWVGDVTGGVSSWVVEPTLNLANEDNYSDIAYDPVSGDLYAIDYSCIVYNITNSNSVVAIYTLAGISDECPSLKIDSDERIWFTSNNAGLINSDILLAPGGDIESFDNAFDESYVGEEFFFGPESFPAAASSDGLASTGSTMNLGGIFGAAGLFFAAAIAFAIRARRLARQ